MFKALVLLLLVCVLVSLGSGLFFLVHDRGQTKRTVKSLTMRIALSLSLFALLFIGYMSGWIIPHPA